MRNQYKAKRPQKEQIKQVLSTLTPREQRVVTLRFGLDNGRSRTLEEVGKELNLTRERIRQIEANALRKVTCPSPRPSRKPQWDTERIQALRHHLGLTQRKLANRLGTRQQTISEWETGMYKPRGASATLLSIIAEQAEFEYEAALPQKLHKKSYYHTRLRVW